MMVLPGSSKSFDQFRSDENQCRQYAHNEVGGVTAKQAATSSSLKSAAMGAGLGAAVGALLGGGEGAAIVAGIGLLAGGLSGSETASASGHTNQQRYDNSYIQCMYAQGHRVPVSGEITKNRHNQDGNISNQPTGYPVPPPQTR